MSNFVHLCPTWTVQLEVQSSQSWHGWSTGNSWSTLINSMPVTAAMYIRSITCECCDGTTAISADQIAHGRLTFTEIDQSDCKVVPFKLTRLSMTFYDFLWLSMTFYDFLPVICINSPVPSLSPAQARRSRKVCQCYGKDLPAVSCVHCVHLFQFSEFPDCLDSMHAHLCFAFCWNML
jgi:hypothetical protein